ncbi:MAG: phosphotransferase family protein [Chloroflexota bacterium]|nr:phosphotransferase family protein [Dehalococcoidia bacterium]MDW8046160.1 phosphotransferase family protein [Chloroflexota bacterium]
MHEALRAVLRRRFADADEIEIHGLAVIAGGYSRETFRFDAHILRNGSREVLPMILRKDPPRESAILHSDRQLEHDLLERLRRHTSLPVSESYLVERDPATFGEAAMILQRMPGSGEVSALFHGDRTEEAEAVATQLCEYLAQLHLTDPALLNPDGRLDDPRGVGIDVSSWERYMDTTIEYYLRSYDDFAFDPVPVFRDAYLYLKHTRPRPLPLRVVHGDFNPANFLYENGRVTAIIDWENAHVGDPREDLGWLKLMDLLSNTNIFGSVKAEGGFLGLYNKLTGFGVTEEEVNYFQIFTGAHIGVPVVSAVKRRIEKKHLELLHLYLTQPVLVSELAFTQLLGYPNPLAGAQP